MTKKEIEKYLKRNDILLEGSNASWHMHATGDIQGTYTGTFRFKCYLTPSEMLAASRDHRELLGPNATLAFQAVDDIAYFLAQLKYRVVQSPPFWSSAIGINGLVGDIPDISIISMIFEAAIAAELKYKAQLEKAKADALKRAKEAAENILAQKERDLGDENDEGAS